MYRALYPQCMVRIDRAACLQISGRGDERCNTEYGKMIMTRFHPPVVKNKRLRSHWLRCLRDKKHLALILRTPWISERLTKEARGTVKCEESICVFNDDWCATPRANRSQLVTVNPVWICISALDRSSLLLNCALTEYSSITARNVSLSAALVEFLYRVSSVFPFVTGHIQSQPFPLLVLAPFRVEIIKAHVCTHFDPA